MAPRVAPQPLWPWPHSGMQLAKKTDAGHPAARIFYTNLIKIQLVETGPSM
jgi:hypothetical protein